MTIVPCFNELFVIMNCVGNPPPEAFQRLIEMELRANSKQIHPFGPQPPGHNQGIYSHELDMESRYQ